MRMSAGTRVVFTIFMIVVICAFLFVLATMFGLIGTAPLEGILATAIHGGFWYKFLYAAICIAMIIIAICLIFFGIRKREPREASVRIAQFNGGTIIITAKAVEELVQREVTNTSGVRACNSKVISYGDFVDIFVHVSVAPGENIPELTKSLQTKLEAELQTQTGITVRDMQISVTDITESLPAANSASHQKPSRVV